MIGRGRKRDRARTRKREINVGARWIGEGRRQPARRMPLLAEVRFWDRLDSVESGQSSGRRYSSPRSRVPRFFFRGPYVASISGPCRVFSSLFLRPISFSLPSLTVDQPPRLKFLFIPLITSVSETRTRTKPVVLCSRDRSTIGEPERALHRDRVNFLTISVKRYQTVRRSVFFCKHESDSRELEYLPPSESPKLGH